MQLFMSPTSKHQRKEDNHGSQAQKEVEKVLVLTQTYGSVATSLSSPPSRISASVNVTGAEKEISVMTLRDVVAALDGLDAIIFRAGLTLGLIIGIAKYIRSELKSDSRGLGVGVRKCAKLRDLSLPFEGIRNRGGRRNVDAKCHIPYVCVRGDTGHRNDFVAGRRFDGHDFRNRSIVKELLKNPIACHTSEHSQKSSTTERKSSPGESWRRLLIGSRVYV